MGLKVCLERKNTDDQQTTGKLFVYDKEGALLFSCRTMELPWKNNQRRISCIPAGVYRAIKHHSPKFGNSFWLQEVPGRSEILIHKGNYKHDTLGCILPGKNLSDINGDGYQDVTSSKATMKDLWNVLPVAFDISIEWTAKNPENE